MAEDLGAYRKSYEKNELTLESSHANPIAQFKKWFEEVEAQKGVEEVNAMTLGTVDANGMPRNRVVLLKGYDDHGFVFYTNYNSKKGMAIQGNSNVCLSFFWPNLERQVIINGQAIKLNEEDSIKYFKSRPQGSKLGAWASPQSNVIPNRAYIQDKLDTLKGDFAGEEIPKPPHWGGYRVVFSTIEFWQGRPNRLHDRIVYEQNGNTWDRKRLAP